MSTSHDPDASEVVQAAGRRGLGRRPVLRRWAALAWSAFLGAVLSLSVLLLMPEGWLDAPVDFRRLSLLFAGLWLLAAVPAASAMLLARHREPWSDA